MRLFCYVALRQIETNIHNLIPYQPFIRKKDSHHMVSSF